MIISIENWGNVVWTDINNVYNKKCKGVHEYMVPNVAPLALLLTFLINMRSTLRTFISIVHFHARFYIIHMSCILLQNWENPNIIFICRNGVILQIVLLPQGNTHHQHHTRNSFLLPEYTRNLLFLTYTFNFLALMANLTTRKKDVNSICCQLNLSYNVIAEGFLVGNAILYSGMSKASYI